MAEHITTSSLNPDVIRASDLNQVRTCLPDALLDDDAISPMAKMAYWYLKRHGGNVMVIELAGQECCAGKPWPLLEELKAAGWIEEVFVGKPAHIEFIVHEVPAVKR